MTDRPPDRRPIFILRIEGRPGAAGIHGLRFLLKRLLRQYGFVCLDIREEPDPTHFKRPQAGARRRRVRAGNPISDGGRMKGSTMLGKRKTGTGGNFLPVIKYDARAGVIYTQDRVFNGDTWQTEQHDVTDGLEAIFDLANIQTGWLRFPKGAAPEMVLKPIGEDIGPRPGEDYKEGLRVIVKIPDDDAGPRELISNALALWQGIDELHNAYLAELEANPGRVPLVTLADVNQVNNPSGISYEPVFKIVDWVARPADLPIRGIAVAAPAPAPASAPAPAKPQKRGNTRADMDDEIPF
jgi:hypothetical protein